MSNAYLEYLSSLTKEQLIEMIYEPKKQSIFFPHKSYRNVALRLSFEGHNYRGIQKHRFIKSIGNELCASLEITGIGSDPVYCGRTDAGVSAISMIVSLKVKSRFESPNRTYKVAPEDYEEYPYDKIINERLPKDIRITGWAPVPDSFSARYTCIQRYYRYYFVLNNLDLGKMEKAVKKISEMENFYILSTHSNPKAKYDRKIDEIRIVKASYSSENEQKVAFNYSSDNNSCQCEQIKDKNASKDDLYYLEIKAHSFLHNMIRKIFWVIKNCGEGNGFVLKNVEIAEAENLVFVSAKYPEELNFIDNRFNYNHFLNRENELRVEHAISKLRFDSICKKCDKKS